ncbi:MAG TPA: SRPBCC family protein [Pyrinomonadaceae bacterium]|jgi:uncharacterized membrane protein
MAANGTALTQAQIDRGEAPAARGGGRGNVGDIERWASAVGGGALALYGLTRGTFGGAALALFGGALLYRGVTGYCDLYDKLGINTAGGATTNPNISVRAGDGIRVEQTVTINRPPAEVYAFWRNFENLPRFMSHVEEVRASDPTHSHWIVRAPAGTSVEWDAEVYNEKENELIAWRSLPGADVDNAGSVHFEPTPDGRATNLRVVLRYDPPAGIVGATVARLFGENPEQQIAADLQRFKEVLESGQAATTEARGASTGR